MHPISGRRIATRTLTSHALLVLVVGAGLSLVPLSGAHAQHGGHHGHHDQGAKKSAPAKKAPSRGRRSDVGGHHAGHAAVASVTPAVAEFTAAHHKMMRDMSQPYTGDPDVDFRVQMIPHHQGAIDMARVALRRANDPWTRQLAEAVIVEQQREIAEMQAWLAKRGITPPPGGQPRHIISASSFRQLDVESGTLTEARGQSWAPSAGVPAAR